MQENLQHKPQPGDERLRVKFYEEQVLQTYLSEKDGVPVFDSVPFVSISVPGEANDEICREANKDDKERFLPLWRAYEKKMEQIDGTSLDAWTEIDKRTKHTLAYLGFTSVEQVAGASDLQVQKMGMSGTSLRIKAKAFLESHKNSAFAQEQATQLDELKQRLAALEGTEAAPRRGRPPKEQHVDDAA